MSHFLKAINCIGLLVLLQTCTEVQTDEGASNANGFYEINSFIPASVAPIQTELRYFTSDNFVGEPIDGYNANKMLATLRTALALAAVQIDLSDRGMGLKVFDAYRPQRAVDHFVRWASELSATEMKQQYYPDVPKDELFERGYISARSGHTRGSAVDLTLVDLEGGEELDMGSPWDFFDVISWPTSLEVSLPQKTNREILRELMLKHGFMPVQTEWWHFSLQEEPFPDTYFDYPIN